MIVWVLSCALTSHRSVMMAAGSKGLISETARSCRSGRHYIEQYIWYLPDSSHTPEVFGLECDSEASQVPAQTRPNFFFHVSMQGSWLRGDGSQCGPVSCSSTLIQTKISPVSCHADIQVPREDERCWLRWLSPPSHTHNFPNIHHLYYHEMWCRFFSRMKGFYSR